MLQEVVPTELLSGGAALNIDAKTDTQESLELLGKALGLLKSACAVGCDEVESLLGFLVKVWRLGFDQFDGHNAERPNVDLRTVFLLLDDFGCHPVGRTNHGGALGALLGELGAETEIGDLDVAFG